jgi:hypothetical protein
MINRGVVDLEVQAQEMKDWSLVFHILKLTKTPQNEMNERKVGIKIKVQESNVQKMRSSAGNK